MLIAYYTMGEFKSYWKTTKQCIENENHSWTNRKWLSDTRVWFEKCRRCGAIWMNRVNDMIYITPKNRVLILICKERWDQHFVEEALTEAGESKDLE